MAQGYKTGGRQKGTPNKPNPIKEHLRSQSAAYFEPTIPLDDKEIAAQLHLKIGTNVSRFDIDTAMMDPKDRAAIHEKLLNYHMPKMQSVSAEVSMTGTLNATIEERLARLALENDN